MTSYYIPNIWVINGIWIGINQQKETQILSKRKHKRSMNLDAQLIENVSADLTLLWNLKLTTHYNDVILIVWNSIEKAKISSHFWTDGSESVLLIPNPNL